MLLCVTAVPIVMIVTIVMTIMTVSYREMLSVMEGLYLSLSITALTTWLPL